MNRVLLLTLSIVVASSTHPAFACGTSRRQSGRDRAVNKSPDALLLNYENARLALLDGDVEGVRIAAKGMTRAASRNGSAAIVERSRELENAADVPAAREIFAALSAEIIEGYERLSAADAVAAYCSEEQAYWLQPKGRIDNPYVEESRRHCGEFIDHPTASSDGPAESKRGAGDRHRH